MQIAHRGLTQLASEPCVPFRGVAVARLSDGRTPSAPRSWKASSEQNPRFEPAWSLRPRVDLRLGISTRVPPTFSLFDVDTRFTDLGAERTGPGTPGSGEGLSEAREAHVDGVRRNHGQERPGPRWWLHRVAGAQPLRLQRGRERRSEGAREGLHRASAPEHRPMLPGARWRLTGRSLDVIGIQGSCRLCMSRGR